MPFILIVVFPCRPLASFARAFNEHFISRYCFSYMTMFHVRIQRGNDLHGTVVGYALDCNTKQVLHLSKSLISQGPGELGMRYRSTQGMNKGGSSINVKSYTKNTSAQSLHPSPLFPTVGATACAEIISNVLPKVLKLLNQNTIASLGRG